MGAAAACVGAVNHHAERYRAGGVLVKTVSYSVKSDLL
jgi:hypothetical protein